MKPDEKNDEARQSEEKKAETLDLKEKLALGKLDLTVEEVEERISPSETNVFDK